MVRTYVTTISLISSVMAVLSIGDVQKCVEDPFVGEVFVKPGGPLDLLYGYIYYKDGLVRNKRFFSPVMKIDYTLKWKDGKYRFEIDNAKDDANSLYGSGGGWGHLGDYHRALGRMYNVVHGQVSIATMRGPSLHKFLRDHLGIDDSMKLLAALLLLAEGVDVPLEYVGSEGREGLACRKGGRGRPLFEVDMFNEKGVFTEAKIVIDFFRDARGGSASRRPFSADEPGFLIQAYVFEFLESYDEAKKFFGAAEKVLEYVLDEDHTEMWDRFFTKDRNGFREHRAAHDTMKKISELCAATKFPFSNYVRPPSNLTVQGYNRDKGEIVDKGLLDFSDCCDIAIYALFCCMIYDPNSGMYQLDSLTGKDYKLSEDLRHFFKETCREPVEYTNQHLHQEWTKVVQDLRLTIGELDGAKGGKSSIIQYLKRKGGARAELAPGLLNMLKVLAKVAGFPEGRRVKLKRIIDRAQDDSLSWENKVRGEVEKYVGEVFQEMSIMPVEVRCNGLYREGEKYKDVYGTVEMTYTSSMGGQPGIFHTLQLVIGPGHGALTLVPKKSEIKPKDRKAIERLKTACEREGGLLGIMALDSMRRFLDKANLALIPRGMIKEIENTKNDMERYKKISTLLMEREIVTIDDKLKTLDQFVPLLDRETGKMEESLGEGDPLVHLITNIIGSVPLQDEATRDMFLEVMRFCHGEHGRLFPKTQTRPDQFAKLGPVKPGFYRFPINTMKEYNVPNMLFRYCAWIRAADETQYSNYFRWDLDVEWEFYGWIYGKILAVYIRNEHEEGIRVSMEDLRLTGPRLSELCGGMALWFSVSTREGSYEGIKCVCDCWEIAPDYDKEHHFISRQSIHQSYPWVPLSDTLRDALCSSRAYAVKLLRIYTCLSMAERDFDALYDLIVKYYDTIGPKEVIWCLRDARPSFRRVVWEDMPYSLPKVAEEYLVATRHFMERMKGFLHDKNELSESVLAELRATHKYIDSQEKAITRCLSISRWSPYWD